MDSILRHGYHSRRRLIALRRLSLSSSSSSIHHHHPPQRSSYKSSLLFYSRNINDGRSWAPIFSSSFSSVWTSGSSSSVCNNDNTKLLSSRPDFCITTIRFQSSQPNNNNNNTNKDPESLSKQQQQQQQQQQAPEKPPETVSLYIVNHILPSSWRPYARLARADRPIGTMLLLWPCLWTTALATPPAHWPDASLCALFAVGSFVMRGAGCTINDMWDSDIDKSVARTRLRPIASKQISHKQALAFLALQLSTGLIVLLSLPHTSYCFLWGVSSLPLVILYPLAKRFLPWPQLVLGLTFNWGIFMGWAAVHGPPPSWDVLAPMYVAAVAWTMIYDTIYAHQDKEDDAKLGLHSTALSFGNDKTKPILHLCSIIALLGWTTAGYASGLPLLSSSDTTTSFYYLGCVSAFTHLTWQIQSAKLNNNNDDDDPMNLMYRFRSNNQVGGIIFISCAIGNYFALPQ